MGGVVTAEARLRHQASHRNARRQARADERRARAAAVLRAASATASYAASRLDGRVGAADLYELAGELERAAGLLRRITPATRAARAAVAREMAQAGCTRRDIARSLGVSEASVWSYLHGR